MEIVLRYTLSVDDVHELNRAYFVLQKRRARPLTLALVAILGLIFLVLIAIHIIWNLRSGDLWHSAGFPVEMLAVIFSLAHFASFARARFTKALAKEAFRRNPHLAEPIETTITATSVTKRSANSMMSMEWNLFSRFYESAGVFLLFTDAGSAQVIPKRAFTSQADMDEFRAFANAHIGVQSLGFPVQESPAATRTGKPI